MAIADLGSLTARISLDTTPLAAGAAAAKGELAGLESSGSTSLNRLASVGKAAFLGMSAAGLAVGAVSLKMASDFQASMELVRTQAGASQAEVDRMSKAILDMAAAVGTSPIKLSEALFHIESAGLRGAEALDVLKIAAMGAKIGNADLESVTNALVAVTTSHIKGVHSQAEAMGVLNAIIGVGNMRMDDLAAAIGTGILPVARSFGLSLQDVGAAMAVMTDQAVPAEVAATRLRTTFALMAAPTEQAQKALASIGISSTALAEAMRHGGIVEAIGLLRQKLIDSGLSATESAALLNKAFGGGETSGTIITLIGNFDSLVAKQKGIAEGATKFAENWEATKETFRFQMDQMKASAEVLGIKIGTFLIPIVLDLIKAIDSAVSWLGKHKDIALALAAAIGGPLVVAMGAFIATELLAAAPVIAIGLAIGALAAAFTLAYTKIKPFHDAMDDLGRFLKGAFFDAVDIAKRAWDLFTLGFDNPNQKVDVGGWQGVMIKLGQGVKIGLEGAKAAWDGFLLGFKNPDQQIDAAGIQGVFIHLGQGIRQVMEGLGPALANAWRVIKAVFQEAVAWIRTGPLADFARYIQELAPQVQEAFTHIVNVIRIVLTPIAAIFVAVFNGWKLLWATFGDDIRRIVELTFGVLKGIFDTQIRVIRDVINFWLAVINGEWGKAWNALKDIVAAAIGLWGTIVGNGFKILGIVFQHGWELILKAAAGALDLLVGFFKALPGRIVGALSDLGGMLVDAGKRAMSGFVNGVEALVPLLFQWFRDLPGRITSAVGDAIGWLKEHGRQTVQGFITGLSEKVQDVLAWCRDELPKKIAEGFKGSDEWMKREAPRIIAGLIQGIKDNAPMIAAGLGIIVLAVALAIPAVTLAAVAMGGAIIAGLILGLVAELPRFASIVLVEIPRALGRIALGAGAWLVDMGRKMIDGLWLGIQIAWDALLNFFRGIGLRIIASMVGAGTWLYNTGIEIIQGLLRGIVKAFELLPSIVQRFLGLDAVISGIKSTIDLLDGAKVNITATADTAQAQHALDALLLALQAAGGPSTGIPGLWQPPPGSAPPPVVLPWAKGGLISKPTISLMGEKAPELVLPLDSPDRARSLLAQHGQGITGGGGQSSVTNYYLNGDIIANDPAELERQLAARARLTAMKGAAA